MASGGSTTKKKSGITETMTIALLGSAGIMVKHYISGGVDAIPDSAITAFCTAAIPFVLRIVQKKREAK